MTFLVGDLDFLGRQVRLWTNPAREQSGKLPFSADVCLITDDKRQRGKQMILVFLAVNQYVKSKSFS